MTKAMARAPSIDDRPTLAFIGFGEAARAMTPGSLAGGAGGIRGRPDWRARSVINVTLPTQFRLTSHSKLAKAVRRPNRTAGYDRGRMTWT
jgi:hypothetical protein